MSLLHMGSMGFVKKGAGSKIHKIPGVFLTFRTIDTGTKLGHNWITITKNKENYYGLRKGIFEEARRMGR